MDTWRKQALVSLESNLKANLSLVGLLSRLERPAGGFMTEDERRSVEEAQGKSNQVGKIIEVLRGKGNRDFDAFLKVLSESGNELWAEKLDEESARQFEEYHKAKEQSGLKAIEYCMEGGSDMAVQLSPQGQEGGTRIVYVPVPVLQRKRSRSSASSGDTTCHPAVKRKLDEYLKMKMDLEKRDMKSVHAKRDRAILLLYVNALKRLVRLLEPHLNEVKDAAIIYLQAGLHEGEEYVKTCDVQSAKSISELLSRMSTKWYTTCFLEQAVDAIPAKAIEREVAEAILSHYNLHLAIYERATLLKDDLAKKESEDEDEKKQIVATTDLVPVELTSFKSLEEFTFEDCHRLQVRILSQAYGIPAEKIIRLDAVERQSTTVTFLVPNRFTYIIMQRTTQLETVWILLELSIIEVAISGFTFKPTMGCFLTLLRGSKPFTADLLGVTEILPYQMHCLVDPGSKEPLSGQPLDTKRIAQHWKLHEESVSDTADNEGVEPAPETPERNFSPNMEEVEGTKEVMEENEAVNYVHGELLSRVQDLEEELKDSERKRLELIHGNTALQNKLEATRKEEGRIHLKMASLEERLLSVLSSQVEQPPSPPAPPSAPPHPLPPPPAHNVEAEVKELAAQVQQAQDEKSELGMQISALQKELIQQTDKHSHQMKLITQSLPSSDTVTIAMLQAAVNGDQSVVQFLVKRFVNTEDKDGRTPLLLAAERGHTDLVRKLAGQYEGDIFHKMKNSRNALHLAAYRGHLPVLQYLCPMFGDRVLDRDGNGESSLDIARRLGRESIAKFLTQNYSQLEDKGGAAKDPSPTASSNGPSKRAHCRHWWLKVSTESRDVALHPSAPMEQTDSIVEMEGEVEFRRDTKSKLMKAVSGTDWMYRRGALERGRRAAAAALLLHRFTRYHQHWLADCVQTEEEESCKQWLLYQSPEVATVREAEEYRPGRVRYRYTTGVGLPAKMMDEVYKQVLRDNEEKVAGVIVMNILPDLRPYLTEVEYSQVESMQPDNKAQVNELFRILLMKEDAHFFCFCHALECNGYRHWAQQLQEASSAHIHAGGRPTNLRECTVPVMLFMAVCFSAL